MIIRLAGGLGNQMFQYAYYCAIEDKNKKIDLSYYRNSNERYRLGIFENVRISRTTPICESLLSSKVVRKALKLLGKYKVVEEDVPQQTFYNKVVEGYFQNEGNFRSITEKIMDAFTFSEGEEKLQTLSKQIKELDSTVSVHIRRGDYLQLSDIYGGICTEEYYNLAKEMFGRDSTFVIFSNDIEWVKSNLQFDKAIYVSAEMFDNYQDWYDMYLMSICKNNIIANSSFSWWGAWLNRNEQKKVIAPKKWINTDESKDICPKEWTRI